MNFDSMKEKILNALNKKCTKPCYSCDSKDWKELLPWFIVQTIQDKPIGIQIWGKSVTYVSTACKNCWNIEYYLLKFLEPNIDFDVQK